MTMTMTPKQFLIDIHNQIEQFEKNYKHDNKVKFYYDVHDKIAECAILYLIVSKQTWGKNKDSNGLMDLDKSLFIDKIYPDMYPVHNKNYYQLRIDAFNDLIQHHMDKRVTDDLHPDNMFLDETEFLNKLYN